MADPRNITHDKKVQDEKKHHGEEAVPDASETPQPGKKPNLVQNDSPGDTVPAARQASPRRHPRGGLETRQRGRRGIVLRRPHT